MAKNHRKEDRLSSLPDAILINILSLLPTNTAASTSVLSHRWRNLWTGVTRLDLTLDDAPNLTDFLTNILLQLTSPKLHSFKIEFDSGAFLHDDDDPDADAIESCFHHISRRNVEKLIFSDTRVEEGHFRMLDSFLNCQSLVKLHLSGPLKFDYKSTQFHLPNLKKLSLINLLNVPDWVWSLCTFVPFLQDLTLVFEMTAELPPNVISPLNLHFLNLKSLMVALIPGFIQVSIDAPKLTHLVISGCFLPYTFRCIPTKLIKACIELRREDEEEDENGYSEDFIWFSDFFRGISSITNLEIMVFRSINILSLLNMNPPMFLNVVRLDVILDGSDFSGWNDLLVSLQCFPNLQHLWVKFDVMGFVDELVQTMWCSPDIVPSCLVDKLEMIKIIGLPLSGTAAGLMLVRYILHNAKVLRKLYFGAWFDEHSQAQELWKERKFCKSFFKLPRSSPTSKVVFSGRFITSSSNTFKKGKLACKMT